MNQLYVYTYPSLLDLLQSSPHSTLPGHHRAPIEAACAVTAGSHWLSVLHMLVYFFQAYSQFIPLSPSSPMSTCPFSTSASLFLPCKYVHLYHFSRFHMYELIYNTCCSLVALVVKSAPKTWETWVQSLGWEDPLEKEWPPTPVFLLRKSHRQRA